MKKLTPRFNVRKAFFIFTILAALSPIAFTFQNFSRLDIEKDSSSMHADLTSALKTSDEDHRAQQLAADVDTLQTVQKKQKRKPAAIYDGNALGDTDETIVSESSVRE